MRSLSGFLFAWLLASAAHASQPIEVMVLGSYHMGNPGRDLHNTQADDVLAPARQKELAAVADGLARFKPTRVAVEWEADDLTGHNLPAYHEYLEGKRVSKRNEIDQIAFRLAKQLGLADVQGIDVEGEFPYEALEKFAKKNGQMAVLDRANAEIQAKVEAFNARQSTGTIAELLREMNDPEVIADDNAFYMSTLRVGKDKEQPGVDLVSSWVRRNLGICARLVQMAEPGDRIFVLFGGGHSFLLRQCFADMPGWKLIEANDYLPK